MSVGDRTVVEMAPARVVRKVVLTFVTLTLVVGALTVLFLCMRAVMEIGGVCADGGPYVTARSCPKGTGWMLFASIWGGIIALGLYIVSCAGLPGPKWWGLAWSALFLSLGWNFWEFGLNPPGENAPDTEWGWIVCGVLFVLMGGVPLLAIATSAEVRRVLVWADAAPSTASERPRARDLARTARPTFRPGGAVVSVPGGGSPATAPDRVTPSPAGGGDDTDVGDLAEDLERLAALHARGELTDSEFRAAKARRISGGTP